MDFLLILLVYVLLFGLGVVFYFYREAAWMQQGPFKLLQQTLSHLIGYVFPESLRNLIFNYINNYLHSRNQLLKCVFGAIVILANWIGVMDMVPLLYMNDPHSNHALLPVVVVFVNLYLFHLSCNRDPGEITPTNIERYKSVYEYDGRLFVDGRKCDTCQVVKPARSKHCSICNRCVHRFDHHCIWTNNDVGALNHGYFILFLFTLEIMIIQGVIRGCQSLFFYAQHKHIFEARVMLDNGGTAPVTLFIAFQHLFMQLPRLVFLVSAMILLIPAVGGFLIYHLYLLFSNQTTNERYKPIQPTGDQTTNERYKPIQSTGNQKSNESYKPIESRGDQTTNERYKPIQSTGNQTTNERFKPIQSTGHQTTNEQNVSNTNNNKGSKLKSGKLKDNSDNQEKRDKYKIQSKSSSYSGSKYRTYQPYNRGTVNNILEVFSPFSFFEKKNH